MKITPSLLEPRSYAGTAIMLGVITGLSFTVLWSLLLSAMEQRSFGETLSSGLILGLFFGLFFGLAMADLFQVETATVDVSDKNLFVSTLNVATSQFGFYPATQSDDFFTFKPSFQAGLVAGRISVQLKQGQAVIVGPKMYVTKLIKQFVT